MQDVQRLKKLREDANKTQAEIAQVLKTTQQYYATYENGHRPLPSDRLRELCLYYHVSADYILGLPENLPYGSRKIKR